MLKLYIFFQESNPEVRNHGKIAFLIMRRAYAGNLSNQKYYGLVETI